MRSTVLVLPDEYDEVTVSSIEVLEANVVAIRADLNELKNDFRAAVARIDNDIKTAVQRLEAEIRAAAAKAERDLEQFATRIERQLAEMHADDKALRDKVDDNYQILNAKIDTTNDKLNNLDRKVTVIDSKLTALLWVVGGLGTFITLAITVGKALRWF